METEITYLDANATEPEHEKVIKLKSNLSRTCFGNPSSSHVVGQKAFKQLSTDRAHIAKYLNCDPEQIIFTGGATESNNLVARGRVAHEATSGKKHIISSNIEHASVHRTLQDMVKHNLCDLTQVSVDERGLLDLKELAREIRPRKTILITLIIGNNEIGTIQKTKQIMKVCKEKGDIFVHFDLTQMVGRYPLDFKNMGMDSASFSAHKFGGPKGIGVLYLKKKNTIDTVVTGGGQEGDLRAGTQNVPSIAGMAEALRISLCRDKANWESLHLQKILKIEQLRDRIQNQISNASSLKGLIVINGLPDPNDTRPTYCKRLYNTLSFSQDFVDSEKIIEQLKREGVCVSVGSACNKSNGSKTLNAIHLSPELQKGTFRISLSHETTKNDIDRAAKIIINILEKELRKASRRHLRVSWQS